jgi:hypothetical protein
MDAKKKVDEEDGDEDELSEKKKRAKNAQKDTESTLMRIAE